MEERAADLASRLSVDEIAGLMLYSIQNKLPMPTTPTEVSSLPKAA